MHADGADRYRVDVPGDSLGEGVYEYAVSVRHGGTAVTYPEATPREPWDWDWSAHRFWTATVAAPGTALRLLAPETDAGRLAFTRIGDGGRQGVFRVVPSPVTGGAALRVALPTFERRPLADYTMSLYVGDRIAPRLMGAGASSASLVIAGRGLAPGAVVHVTLVERDGASWSAAVPFDTAWASHRVPLATLRPARATLLPQGFPGDWNYWVAPPPTRRGVMRSPT
jgi:hypothetical protein